MATYECDRGEGREYGISGLKIRITEEDSERNRMELWGQAWRPNYIMTLFPLNGMTWSMTNHADCQLIGRA